MAHSFFRRLFCLIALATAGCGDGGSGGSSGELWPPPDPAYQAAREACTFAAGAGPEEALGISASALARIPVRHVIVLMKENRSFDHVLGKLHEQGQPLTEPIPEDFVNPTSLTHVRFVRPFRAPTTCWPTDIGHQWLSMHQQVNGGAMDGFVVSARLSAGGDGELAMSYYEREDLPFYYWLASTFALNDRHFASVRSGTFPNRNFLLLGTADGVEETGDGFPDPNTPTLFDALDRAGVTWGVYSDGSLLSGSLGWDHTHRNTGTLTDFLDALDGGTLPAVTFVDGIEDLEDEHPVGDMQVGEAWTRNIYEHARASRYWEELALIWTYDEAGGFFDHVPPPEQLCIARPQDAKFHEAGVRVPMVVISPWARPGFVSHVVEEHTAITRFIETVFGLPALTARDANSSALLEMFDFTGPALLEAPPAPEPGRGGCDR